MTRNELDYLTDEIDRDGNEQSRAVDPKFKKRRRPDYCKKRTPARRGMSQRNNWRRG